jgi:hypothetical protein
MPSPTLAASVSTRWGCVHVRGTVAYDKSQLTAHRRLVESVGGEAITYGFDADRLLVSAGSMTIGSRPDCGLRESRTIGCVSDRITPNPYGQRERIEVTCNERRPSGPRAGRGGPGAGAA